MTRLTHSQQVSEAVTATAGAVVGMPVGTVQPVLATTSVVRAHRHGALATSACTNKEKASSIIGNSHCNASSIWKMNVNESTFQNAFLNDVLNDALNGVLRALSFRDSFPRRNYTIYFICKCVRCGRPESNRHGASRVRENPPHQLPKPACLPVSPRPPNAWGQPYGHPQEDPGYGVRILWRHGDLLSGVSAPVRVSGAPPSSETAVGVCYSSPPISSCCAPPGLVHSRRPYSPVSTRMNWPPSLCDRRSIAPRLLANFLRPFAYGSPRFSNASAISRGCIGWRTSSKQDSATPCRVRRGLLYRPPLIDGGASDASSVMVAGACASGSLRYSNSISRVLRSLRARASWNWISRSSRWIRSMSLGMFASYPKGVNVTEVNGSVRSLLGCSEDNATTGRSCLWNQC